MSTVLRVRLRGVEFDGSSFTWAYNRGWHRDWCTVVCIISVTSYPAPRFIVEIQRVVMQPYGALQSAISCKIYIYEQTLTSL